VEELYSVMKFLRVKPYESWACFKRVVQGISALHINQRSLAMLQTIMKAIMLRRLKEGTLTSAQVPPKTVLNIQVPFSTKERAFYRALEDNSTQEFARLLRQVFFL
jgi:DNA repair protein RAD5